jgi:hypothetical protein
MSEQNNRQSPKGGKPGVDEPGVDKSVQGDGEQPLQGEGDYEAARRFCKESEEFVSKADVEALARKAAPSSAKEARDLARAEESGRDRSKGDDAADPGIMYPGRKPDATR